MKTTILSAGSYPSLSLDLDHREAINAEPGTRVHQRNVFLDVVQDADTSKKSSKTFRDVINRLNNRTHRRYTYTAKEGGGNVTLAPNLPGDILVYKLNTGQPLITNWRSLLVATPDIRISANWPGISNILEGDSIYLLHLEAGAQQGTAFLNAYGSIQQMTLDQADAPLVVASNHLVAFTAGLQHYVQRAGALEHYYHGGAALEVHFTGQGTVWTQTGKPPGTLSRSLPSQPKPRQLTPDSVHDGQGWPTWTWKKWPAGPTPRAQNGSQGPRSSSPKTPTGRRPYSPWPTPNPLGPAPPGRRHAGENRRHALLRPRRPRPPQ